MGRTEETKEAPELERPRCTSFPSKKSSGRRVPGKPKNESGTEPFGWRRHTGRAGHFAEQKAGGSQRKTRLGERSTNEGHTGDGVRFILVGLF